MLKRKMLVVTFWVMMLGMLSGCGKDEEKVTTVEVTTTEEATTEAVTTEAASTEAASTEATQSNDIYEGVYLDYEYNEPELTINANGDGTYKVCVGIIRLAVFEDNTAFVTDAGLEFIAEDGAGNPIKGVITLDGNDAVVTFTESSWSLITDGTAYRYYRP